MKTRDEAIALFHDKYEYLKAVYPSVGPFDETGIYQNPDGGWQLNLSPCAAITLRPGDDEPHETHAAICERWYEEGGAFEGNIPGWLGYPVKDQESTDFPVAPPCPLDCDSTMWTPKPISVKGTIAEFDFGIIAWHSELPWERANETQAYNLKVFANPLDDAKTKKFCEELNKKFREADARKPPDPKALCCPPGHDSDFAVAPESRAELSDAGKTHIPHDINEAIKHILSNNNLRPTHEMTFSCYREYDGKPGVFWRFLGASAEYSRMIIDVRRVRNDIHVTIDAELAPKSIIDKVLRIVTPKGKVIHGEFAVPNYFI